MDVWGLSPEGEILYQYDERGYLLSVTNAHGDVELEQYSWVVKNYKYRYSNSICTRIIVCESVT